MAGSKDTLPNEEWKPVIGHEGRHEVSNLGRIWSVPRPHPAVKTGCIVHPYTARHGYKRVTLAGKSCAVQRLVLTAFVRPSNPGEHAAHLNGDPSDNRLENLAWVSPKENAEHKKLHGTYQIGETHHAAHFSPEQVVELRRLRKSGWCWQDLGDRYGVHLTVARAAGLGLTYANIAEETPAPNHRRNAQSRR